MIVENVYTLIRDYIGEEENICIDIIDFSDDENVIKSTGIIFQYEFISEPEDYEEKYKDIKMYLQKTSTELKSLSSYDFAKGTYIKIEVWADIEEYIKGGYKDGKK